MSGSDLPLPLNFGLADLYEPHNNNAFFVLGNGDRFGASSLILGFHSNVIKERYINAGILEIDADEFTLGAVRIFVEGMYCRQLDITRANFREVNKLCHVFEVTWMFSRCMKYFGSALDTAESFADFRQLFEEAAYFSNHGRSVSLLKIWREKVNEEKHVVILEEHLSSSLTGSEFTLKYLIEVTKDHSVFIRYIRSKVNETATDLNRVSRYMLLNINLIGCVGEHGSIICEIFEILLENEDTAEWKTLNKLYIDVTKNFIKENSGKDKAIKPTSSPAFPSYQGIPNLFYDYLQIVKGKTVEETLDNIAAVSCSLFMVLEYMACYKIKINDSSILKLLELKREREWISVHPRFLDSLDHMSSSSIQMLRNSKDLTSDTSSIFLASESITGWDLFTSSVVYNFKMKLPWSSACSDGSYSELNIAVTGLSHENPDQFNVRLVVDNALKPPTDINFHKISADKIHIVLERQTLFDRKWINRCLSWKGRPLYREDGSVRLGKCDFRAGSQHPDRLVVYYNMGGQSSA